jgi:hypothetical protein
MEYDADSYEAKLAGSNAFESTAARLPVLSVAMQFAYEDIRQSWASSRLPENLPLLIGHKATSLPVDVHQELSKATASARTGWFDTHPCDADRIRAARRLNEPGIFRATEPATGLFADFNALSKTVTRHQYEKQFGLEFADENLIPAEEILRESAARAEAEAVVRKFYGSVNISLKALLTESNWPPLTDQQDVIAEWREQQKASEELRAQAEQISNACGEQQRRMFDAAAAYHLARARFRLKPKEFGLPENATSIALQEIAVRSLIDETLTTITTQLAGLDPFVTALRQRVTLALRFAQATATPDAAREIDALASLVTALGAEMPWVHDLGFGTRIIIARPEPRQSSGPCPGGHGDFRACIRNADSNQRNSGPIQGISVSVPTPARAVDRSRIRAFRKTDRERREARLSRRRRARRTVVYIALPSFGQIACTR